MIAADTPIRPGDPLQPGRPIFHERRDATGTLVKAGFTWSHAMQRWDHHDGRRARVRWNERSDRYFIEVTRPADPVS
jgi:hypothetical protein